MEHTNRLGDPRLTGGGSASLPPNTSAVDPSRPHFSMGKHLFLTPSEHCNCSCQYCYLSHQARTAHCTLPMHDIIPALDRFKSHGVTLVTLVGGEPALFAEFHELVSAIRELGFELIVQTNGSLHPEQLDHLRAVGIRLLSVSVDSPIESVNDRLRFKGAFARADECIRRAGMLGLPLRISTVVSRANAASIESLMAYAAARAVTVVNLHRMDIAQDPTHLAPLNPSPREWLALVLAWRKLAAKSRVYLRAPVAFVPPVAAAALEKAGVGLPASSADTYNLTPDGNVYRCPLLKAVGVRAWAIRDSNALSKSPEDLSYISLANNLPPGACPVVAKYEHDSLLVPICPLVKTTLNALPGSTHNPMWDDIITDTLDQAQGSMEG